MVFQPPAANNPNTFVVQMPSGSGNADVTPTPGAIDDSQPGVIADSSIFSASMAAAPYTLYRIRSEYSYQSGLMGVPVASAIPNTSAEMICVHAPFSRRVVHWTAERFGALPELPSPSTGSSNEVLLAYRIIPEAPQPRRAAGDYLYQVSGVYEYQLLIPLVFGTDSIPSSALPCTTVPATSNSLLNYSFITGVIAPAVSSG